MHRLTLASRPLGRILRDGLVRLGRGRRQRTWGYELGCGYGVASPSSSRGQVSFDAYLRRLGEHGVQTEEIGDLTYLRDIWLAEQTGEGLLASLR